MLVVWIIMTRVKVAAYTLKSEFRFVVIIVEMGSDSIIGNAFRIQVDVTFLARFVVVIPSRFI